MHLNDLAAKVKEGVQAAGLVGMLSFGLERQVTGTFGEKAPAQAFVDGIKDQQGRIV